MAESSSRGHAIIRAPIGILGLVPMIGFALWLALTGRLAPEGKRAIAVSLRSESRAEAEG